MLLQSHIPAKLSNSFDCREPSSLSHHPLGCSINLAKRPDDLLKSCLLLRFACLYMCLVCCNAESFVQGVHKKGTPSERASSNSLIDVFVFNNQARMTGSPRAALESECAIPMQKSPLWFTKRNLSIQSLDIAGFHGGLRVARPSFPSKETSATKLFRFKRCAQLKLRWSEELGNCNGIRIWLINLGPKLVYKFIQKK